MSNLVRCDYCGSERKTAFNMYLELNWQGVDARHLGSPEQLMPVHFCGIKCCNRWCEDKIREIGEWKAQSK